MTIGDQILDLIIKDGLVRAEIIGDNTLFIWQGNAAEQLEALVNEQLFTQPWKERIEERRVLGEAIGMLEGLSHMVDGATSVKIEKFLESVKE